VLLAGSATSAPVVIDGKLADSFWQSVAPARLVPTETGLAADVGGQVRVAIRGRYLYLGARLPEPDGRITARSIGRNPVWEGGEGGKDCRQFSGDPYGAAGTPSRPNPDPPAREAIDFSRAGTWRGAAGMGTVQEGLCLVRSIGPSRRSPWFWLLSRARRVLPHLGAMRKAGSRLL
jgi:hypothetical protein